jgi:hypothetical protein
MPVSDKFNPRLWLRDWLNLPSLGELKEREAAQAAARQMFAALESEQRTMAANGAAMAADGAQNIRHHADRFAVVCLSELPGTPSNELPRQLQSPAPHLVCPL